MRNGKSGRLSQFKYRHRRRVLPVRAWRATVMISPCIITVRPRKQKRLLRTVNHLAYVPACCTAIRLMRKCRRLVRETVEKLGRLDVDVNNAGITRFQRLREITAETMDSMYYLNYRGMISWSIRSRQVYGRKWRSGHNFILIRPSAVLRRIALTAYTAD